jgi:hypothetical protein
MNSLSVPRSEIDLGREFVGPPPSAGLYARDTAAGKDAEQPDDTHLFCGPLSRLTMPFYTVVALG